MTDEKTLLEEILDVRKKIKNGLLDNEDTVHPSETENLLKKKDTNQQNLYNNGKIIKLEKTRNEKTKRETIKKEVNEKAENEEKKNIKKIKNTNLSKPKVYEKSNILNEKNLGKQDEKIKRRKIIRTFFKKREMKKMSFNPFVRTDVEVRDVMKDVIISLFPAIIAAGLVYGLTALLVIVTSIFSAVITEKLFSRIFLNDKDSAHDLSAVITGILMALTLAPLTSLPVVAFGASMAIIFGKLMYGGIGKNVLNPAVVGREFMTVFFPAAMSSGTIWFSQEALRLSKINFFVNFQKTPIMSYLDELLLTSSGSLGSYSAFALILGGLYLLLKNRISWHIPVTLFATSFIATMILKDGISVSMGGLLLTGIFMATDMPTSPSFAAGKIYYGIILGVVIVLLSMLGVKNETLSYVLLILNPFTRYINKVFRPVVFGYEVKEEVVKQVGKGILLTLIIIVFALIFIGLHKIGAIPYLVYLYILVLTLQLIRSDRNKKFK
ncbi:RnfABCDGE type electron transport complex subunit D [Leptotrichia massiliensis]|uniref:RnfABCDGE type electron transport complex subunit D n=1 Tax=Leptotrichia massiliensis TaxID=1852388 RepID=UPI0028F0383C|nr:RnfABCDGE type electron transport complex subunit D [Leptotrichia massiliensis]